MAFDYKPILGAAAVGMTVVAHIPYLVKTLKGTNRPHIFTWLIWSLLSCIGFAGQVAGNAGPGAWVTGVTATISIIITSAAFRQGEKNITASDWVTFLAGLAAIPLWWVTSNPEWSIILISAIDTAAIYPTVRKSWRKPLEENSFMYGFNVPRHAMALLALREVSVTTALYPFVLLIMNGTMYAMLKLRRRFILGLLLCAFVAPAYAADHTTLTIGVQQFPGTFNPNTDSLAIKEYVLGFARPYLTAYDKDWKLTCYLCVKLPSYEDGSARIETGADGRSQVVERYTLQPDAKWDDGVPVTTADVLFTYNVGKYPKSGFSHSELYQGDTASTIADITAIDDKTFEVRLKGVPCQYQDLSDFFIVPEHIERPIFEADRDLYRLHTMYDMNPAARGLYYGPYRISHVERGSSIDLERNPTWWGKRPAFDRIHIQAFENTSTMQSALVSGQVDYLPGEVGIPENIALSIQRRYPGRYNVVFKPTLTDQHLDLDASNPLFADIRVRKALLLAIDRDTANTAIYDGLYKTQTSFLSPLDPLYSADVAAYGYDPKQAAALLDEAGWKPDASGVRVNAQGEKLAFTLMTTSGDQRREELEQILVWYWKQIGVQARIVNQPARILFGQTLPHRQSTGAALYSWMTAPGNIPRSIYGTANIPSAENGYSGENFLGWSNPQMDGLLTSIETACEPAQNKAAWDAAQRLYAEQLPSLPLYYRSSAYVMPNWLKGVEPTGHQVPSSMWVQDWWVE